MALRSLTSPVVFLDDGEGGRHKDVLQRWVNQAVESVEVGSWDTWPRLAQASFLNKLGQHSKYAQLSARSTSRDVGVW